MALMTNPVPAQPAGPNHPEDLPLQSPALCCMKELSLSLFSGLLMLISLPMVTRTSVRHSQVMNHQQKEDCAFLFKLINRSSLN